MIDGLQTNNDKDKSSLSNEESIIDSIRKKYQYNDDMKILKNITIKGQKAGIIQIGPIRLPFYGDNLIETALDTHGNTYGVLDTYQVENLEGDIGCFLLLHDGGEYKFGATTIGKNGFIIENLRVNDKNYEIKDCMFFKDGTGDIVLKTMEEPHEELRLNQQSIFDVYIAYKSFKDVTISDEEINRSKIGLYNSKEKIDEFFEKNIKQHIINGIMISDSKLRELGFYGWLNSVRIGKHGYAGLQDFAEKHGYLWHNIIWCKEEIDQFFEKNIKQHIKDNNMLKQEELIKLGFSSRYLALYGGKHGYAGLQDFAEKHGYGINRSKIGLYNSKEKIDQFFEKNIKQHIKDNNMLKASELIELGFSSWLLSVQNKTGKYGYTGLRDFAEKHGYLENNLTWDKEKIDQFFKKNIKQHIKDNNMLKASELIELGFSSWLLSVQNKTGKYGYTGLRDFAEKHGYLLTRMKIGLCNSKEDVDEFFEKNIKQHIINGIMISESKLRELGFYGWLNSVHHKTGKYGYTGLRDFAEKHGYLENNLTWDKEKIDQFFEKNIKYYINNNNMLKVNELIKLGFYGWLQAVQKGKYGYTGLKDFKIKNNLI